MLCEWLNLSEEQVSGVLQYISDHQAEVDAEYERVLQIAEANRQYWEERNRERFAEIAQNPGQDRPELRARLAAQKAKRNEQ